MTSKCGETCMHLHVHKGDLSEGVESADPQLCPVGPLGPQLCFVSFRATGVFSLFGYQVFPSSVLSLSVRSEADTAGVTLCLFQCSHCSETEQKRLPLLTYRTAVRFRMVAEVSRDLRQNRYPLPRVRFSVCR